MQPILSLGAASVGAADLSTIRQSADSIASRLPFALEWRVDALAETADVLFVDVDTIYGHIDWLRAQAGGRALIALTSRPNGAHDNELARESTPSALEALLLEFESLAHASAGASGAPSGSGSSDEASAPSRSEPAQVQTTELPVFEPAGDESLAATRELPALDASTAPNTTTGRAAVPAASAGASPEPAPNKPPPPRDSMSLNDWMRDSDGIQAIAAMKLEDGEQLIVDRTQSVYYGPVALKPLLPLTQRTIARSEWRGLDATALTQRTRDREPMPLARLRLAAGLGACDGTLASHLDPARPFRLPKWPQIEREFPRHMRIATALMKGPTTIDDLVSQLALPYAEVADFLNGFVAAGFIEQVTPAGEPESAPSAAGERLMGRLRAFGRKP